MLHADLERACIDGGEDGLRTGDEVFAGEDVMLQRGTRDEERALGGQLDEIEGWDCSAGTSEENHRAAQTEDVQRLLEGGLADGIIDDVDAAAICEALGFGFEVGLRVEDDV